MTETDSPVIAGATATTGYPTKAMVLAAGLGKRMRPVTDTIPKPLVSIAGRTLVDRGLDVLERAGVEEAVVNVHYLPDLLIDHLSARKSPQVTISDERDELLDSAGGIVRALPQLGTEPFYILNADTFWIERTGPVLRRMAERFDRSVMDMIILLVSPDDATGHSEGLDFAMDSDGRLTWARDAGPGADKYIYAGAIVTAPDLFEGAPHGPHGLRIYWDRLIAAGRLFGHVLDGHWVTVGTPDAIAPAEAAVMRHGGSAGK